METSSALSLENNTSAVKVSAHKLSWVERVIIFQYTVGPFLYFIRATPFEDSLAGAILLRTIEPLIFLITAISIISLRPIRLDIPILLLCGLGIYGALSGLLQGNHIIDIMGGLTRFGLGIMIYIYFRNSNKDHDSFEYFIRNALMFASISLSITILSVFILKSIFEFNVYLGIASQIMIVLFFYALYKKNVLLSLISVCLILASGKRGVLVALVIGLIVHSGIWIMNVRLVQTIKLLFLGAFAILTVAITAPSVLDPVINKLFPEEQVSINQYSSGRLNEVLSAVDYYSASLDRIVLGSGFGFTYTYLQESLYAENVDEYKNVHFSYINPIITFGAILSPIYFASIIAIISGAIFPIRRNFDWALQCSCVGFLVYWCFVFGLFSEAIFWACLGYLNRIKVER